MRLLPTACSVPKSFFLAVTLLITAAIFRTNAAEINVPARLEGFDEYMAKLLQEWNAPGVAVGVVVNDKLMFAKGYGYRDFGQKLAFTPETLFPIASNTKLFTAVAAGMLVEEGKLTWDKPIRDAVPEIRFYNDDLNRTISLRDMLSHRTGITRHDSIWYKSDFTRRDLFDRVVYLEPQAPPRTMFLYNNLMYVAVGYIIELRSGKTWEDFVQDRIFKPLQMSSTVFSSAAMEKSPDFAVPYTERRDSSELYRIPTYDDAQNAGPAASIISNVDDLSHWVIALLDDGKFGGQQVLPAAVLTQTLTPAIGLPNTDLDQFGYTEILNPIYGLGRATISYRGHLLALHGGDLEGFHSQVSTMPQDHIGAIVLVIGNHCQPLANVITYNLYERLLNMDRTPWSDRRMAQHVKEKQAELIGRGKADQGKVPDTQPSHPLAAFSGEYENPAYGIVNIAMQGDSLQFNFHRIHLPLTRFHYDRFDTPDDEQAGKWSVNFRTNPQGRIDQLVMSLDEADVMFTRKPQEIDPALVPDLVGLYERPNGVKIQITGDAKSGLALAQPGATTVQLFHVDGMVFGSKRFADVTYEFVQREGKVLGLKEKDPSGEYFLPKK
ncbi:MAG: serine hydrolase [Verrucomicrobia bacterium]|nr:serine hydrolase [Verrucomicrobiota bacterium]